MLRATRAAVRAPLEEEGILVLGQGIDGSPKQLVNIFRANPRTILLGAASLWEGIDVMGKALSVVIIVRLPFSVPTDPIFSARCELFEDSFNQYALPQAVLKFKQGFGRLIRSRQDRGAVVILDSRLQTRSYGKVFLESLPPCTVKRGSLRQMPQEIAGWLRSKR
jgi:DNA polymerase-3 subunit epsilon/ATP-dependent DNA helicase DinG